MTRGSGSGFGFVCVVWKTQREPGLDGKTLTRMMADGRGKPNPTKRTQPESLRKHYKNQTNTETTPNKAKELSLVQCL